MLNSIELNKRKIEYRHDVSENNEIKWYIQLYILLYCIVYFHYFDF